jgi:hypothetical protein
VVLPAVSVSTQVSPATTVDAPASTARAPEVVSPMLPTGAGVTPADSANAALPSHSTMNTWPLRATAVNGAASGSVELVISAARALATAAVSSPP